MKTYDLRREQLSLYRLRQLSKDFERVLVSEEQRDEYYQILRDQPRYGWSPSKTLGLGKLRLEVPR